jgi:hypothetical protein
MSDVQTIAVIGFPLFASFNFSNAANVLINMESRFDMKSYALKENKLKLPVSWKIPHNPMSSVVLWVDSQFVISS